MGQERPSDTTLLNIYVEAGDVELMKFPWLIDNFSNLKDQKVKF